MKALLKVLNPKNLIQGIWYMLKAIFTGDKDAWSIASINLIQWGFIPKEKIYVGLMRDIKKDIARAKRKGKSADQIWQYYSSSEYFMKLCVMVGITKNQLKVMTNRIAG